MNKVIIGCMALALCGSASAAQGINFPYQKHYACSWVFTGKTVQAPDLYIAINRTSGAMTLQRQGAEVYHAKQTNPFTWLEMNPDPSTDAEQVVIDDKGNLSTFQGDMKVSQCIEVE